MNLKIISNKNCKMQNQFEENENSEKYIKTKIPVKFIDISNPKCYFCFEERNMDNLIHLNGYVNNTKLQNIVVMCINCYKKMRMI